MGKLPRECFVMLSLTFPFVLELMKMQFLLLCHRTLSLASLRPWCRYNTPCDITTSRLDFSVWKRMKNLAR